MLSDRCVEAIKKLQKAIDKEKPKPVYSKNPNRSRLQRKMDKIGSKIKDK